MEERPDKAILVFDAACPLCRAAVDWILHRIETGALVPIGCQTPERAAWCPQIPEAACMEAMHLVLPDGTVYAGEAALPLLFGMLRGWRWMAAALRLPGVRAMSPPLYRWVARHRRALGVLVERNHRRCGTRQ